MISICLVILEFQTWKHGKGWELGDLNPKTSPGAMTTADRILAQPELLRTLDIR